MPSSARPHTHLHSFPTRRSSDLLTVAAVLMGMTVLTAVVVVRPTRDPQEKPSAPATVDEAPPVPSRPAFLDEPVRTSPTRPDTAPRSEEHTSELQSPVDLVCRLLPAPTPTSTLSLHDALPICSPSPRCSWG